jgi:hypothetical protein
MTSVIPIESLRRSPSAVLFEGRDDVALSVFVTAPERHRRTDVAPAGARLEDVTVAATAHSSSGWITQTLGSQ